MRELRGVVAGSAVAIALLGAAAIAHGSTVAPAATTASTTHRIKAGDNLSTIARAYGVSVRSLMEANGLPSARAKLKVGTTLAIPEGHAARVASAHHVSTGSGKASAKDDRAIGAHETAAAKTKHAVVRSPGKTGKRGAAAVRRAALKPREVPAPPTMVLALPDFEIAPPAFVWPIEGAISSPFGRRKRSWHTGIDIPSEPGVGIVAAADGLVVASGFEPRYGRVIKVDHENGFMTVYAHNSQNLVEIGDFVTGGQVIATVGRTGRATSPHVHFEIRHDGLVYNPLYLLPLPPQVAVAELDAISEDDD